MAPSLEPCAGQTALVQHHGHHVALRYPCSTGGAFPDGWKPSAACAFAHPVSHRPWRDGLFAGVGTIHVGECCMPGPVLVRCHSIGLGMVAQVTGARLAGMEWGGVDAVCIPQRIAAHSLRINECRLGFPVGYLGVLPRERVARLLAMA